MDCDSRYACSQSFLVQPMKLVGVREERQGLAIDSAAERIVELRVVVGSSFDLLEAVPVADI